MRVRVVIQRANERYELDKDTSDIDERKILKLFRLIFIGLTDSVQVVNK